MNGRAAVVALAIMWATIALCVQPARQKPAPARAGRSGAENFPQNPTFSHDVAPILYANCVQCHHPGGAGPISLMSYEDAKRHARQIAAVTKKRFMPPWLPDADVVAFADQICLSEAQIEILGRWAEQGAPRGDLSQAPPAPQFATSWQTGNPDLTLTAPAGYVLPAEGFDVYHNFVFKVPVTSTHYVKTVEIHPGNSKVVHHANILIDRSHSAERMEARHQGPGPGFDGMDVEMESDVFEPEGHFIYWKPGTPVWAEPPNMTWRLSPGTDLILNIHMRPSGKPEPIQPSIGIYFSDRPATLEPMLLQLDRDSALDIPPGVGDFQVADDFQLPLAVNVYAIYPHAHYLGKRLEAYAVLPDGSRKWLLLIHDWDPAWQGIYRFLKPVSLPSGTVISMRYSYDNSNQNPRNPNDPPQRVTAGNRSTDEMAHLSLQVVPVVPSGGGDGRLVLQEALARHKLAQDPNDYAANYNLGALLLARGQPADAAPYFERSLTQRPGSATVLNSLGAALLQLGNTEDALMRLQQALQADPDYVEAHYNLASALALSRHFQESAQQFEWVIQRQPEDADAEARLGSVLAAQQDYDRAEAHLRRALTLDPNNTVAKENLRLLEKLRSRTNNRPH